MLNGDFNMLSIFGLSCLSLFSLSANSARVVNARTQLTAAFSS